MNNETKQLSDIDIKEMKEKAIEYIWTLFEKTPKNNFKTLSISDNDGTTTSAIRKKYDDFLYIKEICNKQSVYIIGKSGHNKACSVNFFYKGIDVMYGDKPFSFNIEMIDINNDLEQRWVDIKKESENFKKYLIEEMKKMFTEKPKLKDFYSYDFYVKPLNNESAFIKMHVNYYNTGIENDIRNINYNHKNYLFNISMDKESLEHIISNIKLEEIIKLAFPE